MAHVVVDRIEEETAALVLGGEAFEVPKALLPAEAREGDWLSFELRVDVQATARARDATAQRLARMTRDDDGGDFSL